MVKTPCFQCGGPGFDPRLGNYNPTCHVAQPKKKKSAFGGGGMGGGCEVSLGIQFYLDEKFVFMLSFFFFLF